MLNLPDLGRYLIQQHTHDLFRIETLTRYTSASDGDEFDRYLRGEAGPNRDSKRTWLERIATDAQAGRQRRRVRVLDMPPTDYQRYSCEWGYTDNSAAGEQVRVLYRAATPDGILAVGDFYLVDGIQPVQMSYDQAGQFVGASLVEPGTYRDLAEAAWDAAQPFVPWWAAHPEYHQAARAA